MSLVFLIFGLLMCVVGGVLCWQSTLRARCSDWHMNFTYASQTDECGETNILINTGCNTKCYCGPTVKGSYICINDLPKMTISLSFLMSGIFMCIFGIALVIVAIIYFFY